jgi:hypothetical protein
MGLAVVPWASSVPSTVMLKLAKSLNFTTVPGWMVSVAPAGTWTLPMTRCTSVLVQTVPLGMSPNQLAGTIRSSSVGLLP